MTEHLMQLSTTVAPAKTFTIDEVVYELLGMDHLSPDAESVVMATFSRYGSLAESLEKIKDEDKGAKVALKMRELRINVLEKMTTCPRDVIESVPMSGQIVMMNALRVELEESTGGDGDDGVDTDEDETEAND